MATKVEEAIDEIDGHLARFAPQHEGLRDFGRLNLSERTHEVVRNMIRLYDRRLVVLQEAKVAMQALLADHHPDIPIAEIDQVLLDDLKENVATLQAALPLFTSNTATDMDLRGGDVTPKTP